MRLLNTRTLKLESFNESDIPPYAILSHTWGDDEVLFRDVVSGTIESWGGKAGARKVLEAIEAAKAMSYNYLWVDTCCIDKESSAELSEAINSMYKWYKHSKICFVYLSDVKETNFGDDFPKSRWFTRGWTLQELIAPSGVQFFDTNWVDLGSKHRLADTIEKITGVSRSVLLKMVDVLSQPVSCRMARAAHRDTTRTEDQAYSLMGIFDVNMPLLYGEGTKAIRRLQEEIIKQSNDHTILLHSGNRRKMPLLLSSHPFEFIGGQRFRNPVNSPTSHLQIQGRSLHVNLLLAPLQDGRILGILDSDFVDDPTRLSRPAIMLNDETGLHYRADHDILRVTPVDSYTANAASVDKKYSQNFTLDLSSVRRETISLAHSIVPSQIWRMWSVRQYISLRPIVQEAQESYAYGPCFPPLSGSTVQLHDIPYEGLSFRGCISLMQLERQQLCHLIWVLNVPNRQTSTTQPNLVVITDAKRILTAESYKRLHSSGFMLGSFMDVITSMPTPRFLERLISSQTPSLRSVISASDNKDMGITATLIPSTFFERERLELEVKCESGRLYQPT